jgi:hydroxymethylpyrimidine/phosphomethylpyrimidine kinase
MEISKALTIAGSDSGGGAGIQADLKTFSALGVYGASVITAVTAQNTQTVSGILSLPPEFVALQLETVLSDFSIQAMKTGMLAQEGIIKEVSVTLKKHASIPLVIDPVMISKSGHSLLQTQSINTLKTLLFPMALVVTPNIPEAEALTQMTITNQASCEEACRRLVGFGADSVVLKGGHQSNVLAGAANEVVDWFFDGNNFYPIRGPWIDTPHTHGTGCTFSAAITACLAKGYPLLDAVQKARDYLTAALQNTYPVGKGKGPVHHFYSWWGQARD